MTTIGVTGHMDLAEKSLGPVRAALSSALERFDADELVGVSCLAEGADVLFAEAVLAAGGRLVAVIPSEDYRDTKVAPEHLANYDRLVEAAAETVVMPCARADRQAYDDANAMMLERADLLIAIWDGHSPGGQGGTADAVARAEEAGVPVEVVWPEGAARRRQRSTPAPAPSGP